MSNDCEFVPVLVLEWDWDLHLQEWYGLAFVAAVWGWKLKGALPWTSVGPRFHSWSSGLHFSSYISFSSKLVWLLYQNCSCFPLLFIPPHPSVFFSFYCCYYFGGSSVYNSCSDLLVSLLNFFYIYLWTSTINVKLRYLCYSNNVPWNLHIF